MTVFQPPAGARDLLPLDVAQKQWIEHHLNAVFARWGYHQIVTSTLERLDMLMAGGAIDPNSVIQLQDPDDGLLGLRPELTASIARAAVTRLTGAAFPQRLYYNTNVFRREPHSRHGRQHEFHQAGVELLGAGGSMADAEILLLLSDCLTALELTGWKVVLGQADLTRSLLGSFPMGLRDRVRAAIAQLDRVALLEMEISEDQRARALALFELRGEPQAVLDKLDRFDLDAGQRQSLAGLAATIETLAASGSGTMLERLVLDLSTIETYDYYTGVVFAIVVETPTGPCVLGKGGRYDDLLGLYHPTGESRPGVGFGLCIEDLQQALQTGDRLPATTCATDWLVAPKTPAARAATHVHARQLRAENPDARVEVALEEIATSADVVSEYARRRRVQHLAWVAADGSVEVEALG
ncbi:MAG: ATP phosphoribosyltransferase regulatory subunit [Geitlerinemataceae cyanobacterium]